MGLGNETEWMEGKYGLACSPALCWGLGECLGGLGNGGEALKGRPLQGNWDLGGLQHTRLLLHHCALHSAFTRIALNWGTTCTLERIGNEATLYLKQCCPQGGWFCVFEGTLWDCGASYWPPRPALPFACSLAHLGPIALRPPAHRKEQSDTLWYFVTQCERVTQ